MKEQIGILGVGQCGGNIASLFEQKGYECAYINTSMEDLNSLKNAKYKIHVKGGEGASKNRKAVLQLAAESIENIIGKVNELLPQKYLVVCFSAGGGTGSGLSPFLCTYLAQTGRIIVPVVVLPDHTKESVKTCENAYNCCKDLSTAQGLGTMFLLDNGKDDKFIINSQFVREFDAMINMTTVSSYGNVDISEIKTMLSTSGIAIISKLPRSVLTKFGIGFAPDSWDSLCKAMEAKGFTREELQASGLVSTSSKNNSIYDRFRNRLMFPIIDVRGNVIGFGGRVMDDSTPKAARGRRWRCASPMCQAAFGFLFEN